MFLTWQCYEGKPIFEFEWTRMFRSGLLGFSLHGSLSHYYYHPSEVTPFPSFLVSYSSFLFNLNNFWVPFQMMKHDISWKMHKSYLRSLEYRSFPVNVPGWALLENFELSFCWFNLYFIVFFIISMTSFFPTDPCISYDFLKWSTSILKQICPTKQSLIY